MYHVPIKEVRFMAIGDNIRYLRVTHGMSQPELGKIAGVSDKAVSSWETGAKIPRMGAIERIAAYFRVSKSAIIDGEFSPRAIPAGFESVPDLSTIPLVGHIACGEPILAEENIEETVSTPSKWHADFALTCKGDSMAPTIQDGDLVAIRIQPRVETGEIAAVRIGNEATLKRVYLHDDYIELRPDNHDHPSIIRRKNEMNDVHIEGKAVGLCRGL